MQLLYRRGMSCRSSFQGSLRRHHVQPNPFPLTTLIPMFVFRRYYLGPVAAEVKVDLVMSFVSSLAGRSSNESIKCLWGSTKLPHPSTNDIFLLTIISSLTCHLSVRDRKVISLCGILFHPGTTYYVYKVVDKYSVLGDAALVCLKTLLFGTMLVRHKVPLNVLLMLLSLSFKIVYLCTEFN